MGLVNAVVEPDHLLPAAQELAARLAAGPTAAYAAIKRVDRLRRDRPPWPRRWPRRPSCRPRWAHTEDHRNATAAFVAKQKPIFTGR